METAELSLGRKLHCPKREALASNADRLPPHGTAALPNPFQKFLNDVYDQTEYGIVFTAGFESMNRSRVGPAHLLLLRPVFDFSPRIAPTEGGGKPRFPVAWVGLCVSLAAIAMPTRSEREESWSNRGLSLRAVLTSIPSL